MAKRLPGAVGGGAVMVMLAEADLVVSAIEVALRETEAGLGGAAGAAYVTELTVISVSVPQVDPEQPVPDSDQETPRFCGSFCTVTLKGCD